MIDTLAGDAESEKSMPVPLKAAVWELPLRELSLMFREPVRLPVALGWKVMLMVQFAPAARLLPQLFVWAKSPVTVMLLMASAAVPLLVRVAICATLVVFTA